MSAQKDPLQMTREEFVSVIRDHGVVGAGGAGFPTYFKYVKPTEIFVLNATESEPGYFSDKLMMKKDPERFFKLLQVYKDVLEFDRIVIGVKEKEKEKYFLDWQAYADETGLFEMAYVPALYNMGDEKWLVPEVTGRKIPRKGIPPEVGVTVNNTETLWNMYEALWNDKPVTHKWFHIYGEWPENNQVKVFKAPIGTSMRKVLELAGMDVDKYADTCWLRDGGPYLADPAIEDLASDVDNYIVRTSNSLLVVHDDKHPKVYADVEWKAPQDWGDLSDGVDKVRIPYASSFGAAPEPVVDEGDSVEIGDLVARAIEDELSVPSHASISGTVTEVTDEYIIIERS